MNKPILIYLLALGAFLAGTAELVVVGIVDIIASDLHVGLGLAGQLVTAFSISFAAGTPVFIMLTAKADRKKLLLLTLVFSAIGNGIAMISDSILPMMISRVMLGVTSGAFTVIAFTAAAELSAPEKRGRAIGNVHVGFSGSLVIGVPIGITVARYLGWESIFGILAVLNAVLFLIMQKLLPAMPGREEASLGSQAALVRNRKVFGGLAVTFLCVFGYSICYTYLAPYLQKLAGLDLVSVSWVMLLMGICGMIGSRIGGHGTDKWGAQRLLLVVLAVHACILLLSPFLASSMAGLIILIAVWGLSAWATVPAIQYYLISLVPESAPAAVSLNTSVFQLGIALGAAAGGVVVERSTVLDVGWAGGCFVLLGLITAWFAFAKNKASLNISLPSAEQGR